MLKQLLTTETFGTAVSNIVLDTMKLNSLTTKFAAVIGLKNGTTTIDGGCITTGKIQSSVVIDEAIERRLSFYVTEKKISSLTLKVNPILGAYLTKGLFSSIVGKWKKKYKCKIEVVETTEFSVLQNEFYDEKGGKLD